MTEMNDLEAAKLLLDEWKFRQQHGWDSLRQYGLAAVTVSIVPYLRIDLFAPLGHGVLVFPIAGECLATAAVWLFAAEYVRFHPVAKKYQELLAPYYPEKQSFKHWLFRPLNLILARTKIGWLTVLVFWAGFSILSYISGRFLLRLVATTIEKSKAAG